MTKAEERDREQQETLSVIISQATFAAHLLARHADQLQRSAVRSGVNGREQRMKLARAENLRHFSLMLASLHSATPNLMTEWKKHA